MPRPQFFPARRHLSRPSSSSRGVSYGFSQNVRDPYEATRRQYPIVLDSARSGLVSSRPSFTKQGPFDRLPVELHVEIFSHCLSPFPSLSINEAPLLIALVCKTWKELVYNTPRLWSSFEIEILGSPSGTSAALEDMHVNKIMEIWLHRSGNQYPLSVRVIHDPVGRVADHRSAPLLLELIKHARRWRHVEFVVPSASMAVLQNTFPEDFPTLRSLTLQMKGLWNSSSGLDVRTTGIPWAQLTALKLQVDHSNLLTLDECLDLLSKAVNLTSCTMNADCVLRSQAQDRQPLRLSRLLSLHLVLQGGMAAFTEEPEVSLTSFLHHFTGIELESFHIEWLVQWNGGTRNWSGTHTAFLSFLQGLAPSLRSLSFAYLPLEETELMECLEQLPYLTQLDLRFSLGDREHDPITDRLLQHYTLPSSDPPLSPSSPLYLERKKKQLMGDPPVSGPPSILPALEKLHLQCHGESCTNARLLALIQSRWNPNQGEDLSSGSALKFFRFVSMKRISWDIQSRLKQWNDEGLDIMIHSVDIR